MARRGERLRDHILWVAKDVFLEFGYERTSMDVVAARAETSKRSLYAHVESKEKLFLAVIELVRGLSLERLGQPAAYSSEPAEALTQFCQRYLDILTYEATVRLCRISMAEAERFPEQAALYFDVLFTQVRGRLEAYLVAAFEVSPRTSADAAERLLARVLHPRFQRVLFGLDAPAASLDRDARAPDAGLETIRDAVAELITSLRRGADP